MPVGDHHLAAPQFLHAVRRHKLAGAVEAKVAQGRVQFLKTLPDGDVRADDQDGIGKAIIPRCGDAVEDGP